MQILIAVLILIGVAVVGMFLFRGYPSTVGRLALALYRHSRKIERMQAEARANLNQSWTQELEGSINAD